MEFTRRHALHYWNLWHSYKKADLPVPKRTYSQSFSDEKSGEQNDSKFPKKDKLVISVPFVDDNIDTRNVSTSTPLYTAASETIKNPISLSVPFVNDNIKNSNTPVDQPQKTELTGQYNTPTLGSPVRSSIDKSSKLEKEQVSQKLELVATDNERSGDTDSVIDTSSSSIETTTKDDPTSVNLEKYENYIKMHCTVSPTPSSKGAEEEQENVEEIKEDNKLDGRLMVCHCVLINGVMGSQ